MRVISFDGLALSSYEAADDLPLEFESNLMNLAGLAGAFDADGADQRRRPLVISRNFEIVESTYAAVGTTLAGLRARANRGLGWLIVEMRDATTRGTWAKLKRVQAPNEVGLFTFLPVNLTFEVSWPWLEHTDDVWYLDAGEVLDDGLTLDANYSSQVGAGTFTINNTGDDRILRGRHLVIGASTNPNPHNTTTGEWWQYTGTVAAGETLVVDLGKQTAEKDAANVWADISMGTNQARLFSLATGNNSITFSGGGTLQVHWARVY
ncbi:MAG: hypothetical protein GY805_05035 [Chloroflexi bacterium]|nr:hypothetical protein [Chloroflexota bacterium]